MPAASGNQDGAPPVANGFKRVMVDGHAATAADLRHLAISNYGHFTAMQVRDGRVRGLDLHLARLDTANRELFDRALDHGLVLEMIRAALGEDLKDASVRVYVVRTEEVHVVVTTGAPAPTPTTPQSLMPVSYQRFLPHIKHLGGFPQAYLRQRAGQGGFDEALLTTPDGTISEGAITNIGCFDGTSVVWPDAPLLYGTAMRLVELGLARRGIPVERRPIRVADLPGYTAVFLTNSHGVAAVSRVGDTPLKIDEDFFATLLDCYEATPWDPI
ncbi:aminotransferase class IV family protein [Streptosporangium sp. NPDC000396]|uniref:aminotransferase class IV family protein n=1 Tax=Streptosporangium sp. NPDC000396 TaxID=3366185 RepID=UPI0036B72862